ncbi:GMC oxidoreductase [Kangiella shandongensis]|uniref:GMC oxidoreductase n=1 Tax=Kangiella shandongensis TaxID=2763258 RepID=UPI001CBCED70|nr:GMC oxidoreductase [Kangiella shandongensis]
MTFNYTKFYKGIDPEPQGENQGYPVPGPQGATADQIAGNAFFASECEWKDIVNQVYDYIVIGTGPTGVAFIDQIYKENPHAKILVLERGGFWLPVHYQMLPSAFAATSGSPPTTYPWSRTTEMVTTAPDFFQAGYIPAVGGRSTYWSAWSPSPTPDLMRDWPQEMIDITLQDNFWPRAKDFLHVTSMDKINDGVYANLQTQLDQNIAKNFKKFVPSAENAYPAPIAVDNSEWKTVKFYKYSTVGTLLNIQQRQKSLAKTGDGTELTIVDQCVVEELLHNDKGTVIAIETSRGTLSVSSAKVILAMGAIPPATLLMNSFGEQLPNAGKRYTGHFMSHVTARVKRSAYKDLSDLEIGAVYLDGKDSAGYQYHVQASVFAETNPEQDAVTTVRECPDAAAAPSMQQLVGSEDYVVFVCATLGEISEKNSDNWIKLNKGKDPTTNISLQLILGNEEKQLWDQLDEATYQTIAALATDTETPEIEYWIDTPDGGHWTTNKPPVDQIRLNIIVHEASQIWVGEDPESSVVGLDYRPHGVTNVYVTGAGLFPTSGSWNPTLTMCGFAQDLAVKLSNK